MQYILTEEEYNDLRKKADTCRLQQKKWTQELCTKIANTMPAHRTAAGVIVPWGCAVTEQTENNADIYCDGCPVVRVCPCDYKEFSK